ncbi:MAG: 30S ribosomal protein S3, partial [Nanoarchaeota archaeon]
MIERNFIAQKTKEYYITQYVKNRLNKVGGISSIKLKKIPMGEKIIINTNRPSIIVGSKGSNIKELTKELKREFNLENPQIEINEVRDLYLDANLVAERITSSLERFGSARFKSVGHKIMENVIKSGALGIEIVISGKIPSARAKSWRFYQGYLKKCGDIAISGVKHAQATAVLKTGMIGVKVSIMPPDLILPDSIEILSEPVAEEGEIKKESSEKIAKKERSKKTEAKEGEAKQGETKPEEKKVKKAPTKKPAKKISDKNSEKAEETAKEATSEEIPIEIPEKKEETAKLAGESREEEP